MLLICNKLSTLLSECCFLWHLYKKEGLAWRDYYTWIFQHVFQQSVSGQGLPFCPGLLRAIANQPTESDHIVLGYQSSVLAGRHSFFFFFLFIILLDSCALVAIRRGRKRVSCAVSLRHINHKHRISGTPDSTISPGPAPAHCEDR